MKKVGRIILLLLAVTLFSACQPTPDRPIVIEKNDLEQKIMQTTAPQQSQQVEQKTWQEMLDFKSGVKVTVDADIDRPLIFRQTIHCGGASASILCIIVCPSLAESR